MEELGNLVSHLSERLTDDSTEQKVFRDSAVQNFGEFFRRIRELNVRSNPELDELVGEAQQIVRGLGPQALRDNRRLRQQVVDQLREVGVGVDSLLVDRPRRRIIRSQEEPDLDRKPRVCDWDRIERARRICPTELGADVWFVVS